MPPEPPKLATPDITPVQLLAVCAAIAGLFVALGLVDNNQVQAFLTAASVIIPTAWIWADALIRHGRSRAFLNAPKPVEPPPGEGTKMALGRRGA